jgi:hypothetical protein
MGAGVDEPVLGLLIRSAATNAHAAERLRAIAATQIVRALERTGVDDPERRAALVASQMLGLAVCRYVLAVPSLVAAAPEQLVEDLGPTVQRYLTAPLSPAAPRSSS